MKYELMRAYYCKELHTIDYWDSLIKVVNDND